MASSTTGHPESAKPVAKTSKGLSFEDRKLIGAKLALLGLADEGSMARQKFWEFVDSAGNNSPAQQQTQARSLFRMLQKELGSPRAKSFVAFLVGKLQKSHVNQDAASAGQVNRVAGEKREDKRICAKDTELTVSCSCIDEGWVQMVSAQGRPYFWDRWKDECSWSLPDGVQVTWLGRKSSKGSAYYWKADDPSHVVWRLPELQRASGQKTSSCSVFALSKLESTPTGRIPSERDKDRGVSCTQLQHFAGPELKAEVPLRLEPATPQSVSKVVPGFVAPLGLLESDNCCDNERLLQPTSVLFPAIHPVAMKTGWRSASLEPYSKPQSFLELANGSEKPCRSEKPIERSGEQTMASKPATLATVSEFVDARPQHSSPSRKRSLSLSPLKRRRRSLSLSPLKRRRSSAASGPPTTSSKAPVALDATIAAPLASGTRPVFDDLGPFADVLAHYESRDMEFGVTELIDQAWSTFATGESAGIGKRQLSEMVDSSGPFNAGTASHGGLENEVAVLKKELMDIKRQLELAKSKESGNTVLPSRASTEKVRSVPEEERGPWAQFVSPASSAPAPEKASEDSEMSLDRFLTLVIHGKPPGSWVEPPISLKAKVGDDYPKKDVKRRRSSFGGA